MRRALLVGLSLSLLIGALPALGHAQIYRYTDERGQNHYVDGIENVPERHRATATPLGMRNAPKAAPMSTSAPAATRPAGTVIKYTPGQRIMVDVKINGAFTTQLLLDTGADRTMISPRTLQAAPLTRFRPTK